MRKVIISILIVFYFFSLQGQIKRALFIGNSYTSYNTMPQMVADMAASTGNNLVVDSSAMSFYTLEMHSTEIKTRNFIEYGYWDFVILQEFSQYPSESLSFVNVHVYPFARYLDSVIGLFNPNAKTVFFMTWGRKNGDADRCPTNPAVCTYLGMDNLTRERYMGMASDNHAVVSPVGAVWRYLRQNYPALELYSSDESHPSAAGSYAAACCFYTVFYKKDPSLITYNYTLSPSNALVIKNAVKAVVFDSLTTWYAASYEPDTLAPTAPTGLVSNNLTETSFTLKWHASTDNVGVTRYDVYRDNSWIASVSDTFATIGDLKAFTTYAMKVTASDSSGNTSYPSNTLNVTTLDTHPPDIPSELNSDDLTETSFRLKWNASIDNVGVTGYDVYRDNSWIASVTDTFASINSLKAYTTYAIKVTAKDAAGNSSSASNALYVTTMDTHAPSVPSGLTSYGIKDASFMVRWTASTDNVGIAGYDIYQNDIWISFVTSTSVNITDLKASTTYAVKVIAKDMAGNFSAASDGLEVTTTDTQAPTVPAGLAVYNLTGNSFTLGWIPSTDNAGVAGYDIYRNDMWITFTTDSHVGIAGLKASTTYTMMVTARDAAGNVSVSSPLQVTTLSTHLPLTSSGSLRIYPNPVSGNEFYVDLGETDFRKVMIEVMDCDGKILQKHTADSPGPGITISGVNLPDGMYFIRICSDDIVFIQKILIDKN